MSNEASEEKRITDGVVPSWVHCVGREDTGRKQLGGRWSRDNYQVSWCGDELVAVFMFLDASHALLNAAQGGRLQVCPGCSKAMREALSAGTWER